MLNWLKNLAAAALVALPLGMLIIGAPDAQTEREAITMLTIGDRDLTPWPVGLPEQQNVRLTPVDAERPRYDLSPPPIEAEGFAGIAATPEALALAAAKWPAGSHLQEDVSPEAFAWVLAAMLIGAVLLEGRWRPLKRQQAALA